MTFWTQVSAAVAVGITIVILGMAAAVLWNLFTGKISLTCLLAEPANPDAMLGAQRLQAIAGGTGAQLPAPPETVKASLSRFQFLIFTFVIAGVYLVLCLETGRFVEVPENVLWLLGISGGTYAASKGIKAAGDKRPSSPPAPAPVHNVAAPPPVGG